MFSTVIILVEGEEEVAGASVVLGDELVELDEFSVFVDDCSVVFSTVVVLVEDVEDVVGLLP